MIDKSIIKITIVRENDNGFEKSNYSFFVRGSSQTDSFQLAEKFCSDMELKIREHNLDEEYREIGREILSNEYRDIHFAHKCSCYLSGKNGKPSQKEKDSCVYRTWLNGNKCPRITITKLKIMLENIKEK
jgi:hypothetical protein